MLSLRTEGKVFSTSCCTTEKLRMKTHFKHLLICKLEETKQVISPLLAKKLVKIYDYIFLIPRLLIRRSVTVCWNSSSFSSFVSLLTDILACSHFLYSFSVLMNSCVLSRTVLSRTLKALCFYIGRLDSSGCYDGPIKGWVTEGGIRSFLLWSPEFREEGNMSTFPCVSAEVGSCLE